MKINISDFKIVEFKKSDFIKPLRASFVINEHKVDWDFIKSFDSVSIMLYHESKDSFIFVKQFRAPLYYYENCKDYESGFSVELCSGIIDKNKSLEEIALDECIEELGFKPKKLVYINKFYTGFGSGVNTQHLFFARVSDDDIVGVGGGVDNGEFIKSVYVKINEYDEFFAKNKRSALIDYANLWFRYIYKK
ncbi:NUDIX domain-containing protein [Campylobacter sp. RM9333]|uniref:NUDIX domain-containing protein n=1 Tax=Campylobacter sp. RM9333 TaxID=2735731 RepID=UPI003FA437A4